MSVVWNYCPGCRQAIPDVEVDVVEGEMIHDPRRGGCSGPVFNCTESEFWGVQDEETRTDQEEVSGA